MTQILRKLFQRRKGVLDLTIQGASATLDNPEQHLLVVGMHDLFLFKQGGKPLLEISAQNEEGDRLMVISLPDGQKMVVRIMSKESESELRDVKLDEK